MHAYRFSNKQPLPQYHPSPHHHYFHSLIIIFITIIIAFSSPSSFSYLTTQREHTFFYEKREHEMEEGERVMNHPNALSLLVFFYHKKWKDCNNMHVDFSNFAMVMAVLCRRVSLLLVSCIHTKQAFMINPSHLFPNILILTFFFCFANKHVHYLQKILMFYRDQLQKQVSNSNRFNFTLYYILTKKNYKKLAFDRLLNFFLLELFHHVQWH